MDFFDFKVNHVSKRAINLHNVQFKEVCMCVCIFHIYSTQWRHVFDTEVESQERKEKFRGRGNYPEVSTLGQTARTIKAERMNT